MAYTGHSDYSADEPSTFVVVGEQDGIAPPPVMERRVAALRRAGTETVTSSHRDAFCGGKSLNRLCEEVFQYHSVSVAQFAFQACLIDRSSISPFRINDLQSRTCRDPGDCDKSSNVPRSLTGFSSVAVPLLPQ